METTFIQNKDHEIILKASHYVQALFKDKLSKKYVYHNYRHTADVAHEAALLANEYQLPEVDREILLLAAWFHDTGYINTYQGHEERSVEIATAFLQQHNYPAAQIRRVKSCIMATKAGSQPAGLLEEILADADISNIGKKHFFANAELLRAEWEIFLNKFYSEAEWAQFQLDFLQATQFRTEAAQQRYNQKLAQNRREQQNILTENAKKKKRDEKKKRQTFAQPKRGIETMFQSTYSNHMNLSSIADNKANMMISLNAIIMSVIITYLGAKTSVIGTEFTRNPILMIPVGILLLTTLGSVVSAILSAQPEVTSFKIRPHKVQSKKVNLLFFGNFTKLSLEDFQAGMYDLMRERDALYLNMITDIYYLGEVLAKKYRLLRISYTIFMIGLILTVISFVIAISR